MINNYNKTVFYSRFDMRIDLHTYKGGYGHEDCGGLSMIAFSRSPQNIVSFEAWCCRIIQTWSISSLFSKFIIEDRVFLVIDWLNSRTTVSNFQTKANNNGNILKQSSQVLRPFRRNIYLPVIRRNFGVRYIHKILENWVCKLFYIINLVTT